MVLPLLDDSLARAVLWGATLDAVVDGERPVAELVTLVLAALPVEREVVIIEDVLRMTRALVDRYSDAGDPARRAGDAGPGLRPAAGRRRAGRFPAARRGRAA